MINIIKFLPITFTILLYGCGGGGSDSTDTTNTSTFDCSTYVQGTSDKQDFLCAHNTVRANAIPTPVPALTELTWNDNLATVAQGWADTCDFSHNANRTTEYNNLSGDTTIVGENLYATINPNVTPYDAVTAWAAEAVNYTLATDTCAAGEVCGHYTQLVWSDTLQVGCGVTLCPTLTNFTNNATIVVCNYEPAGNFIGVPPYSY